ncbi:MAG TPA: hypothetical protein VGX92_11765 [Pyrinomonadaceae bacterium]|nr:hypothetical protein [Pyrinomonadaceae bacterium]
MRVKTIATCAALITCTALSVRAQQAESGPVVEQPVALSARPVALDARGRETLGARLLTPVLQGTPDSPVPNIRLVVENISPFFYEYVSGRVTFYDGQGVRCGEGLFKFDVLAPREQAETDTPGLRLSCTPVAWRIVATNLLTRTSDTAKPNEPTPAPSETTTEPASPPASPLLQFVNLDIDGIVYRVPLGSTVAVPVTRKSIKINVSAAP